MVAKEVFVSYHNFNPNWVPVQYASIYVKKVLVLKSKKVQYMSRYLIKSYTEPGLEPEPNLDRKK
jgi:hypothetical protein